MTSSLLRTKLYRPADPFKHVPRPFLVQRLHEGLAVGRQLTLVSAPAGFGKTTCIGEWLNTLEFPITWLSLDTADDDPGRFFTYLVIASNMWNSTAGFLAGIFMQGGFVFISFIMLGSKEFSRGTATSGILSNGLDLIHVFVALFAPSLAAAIMMVGGVFYLIWFSLLGRDLFRLGSRSSQVT